MLALEDVANDEDKAFLIGTLLIRIVEHLRLQARVGARDRAAARASCWRKRTGCCEPGATAPARTRSSCSPAMLAEIRAYGEGIVVAEQIPAKLVPDVVKNTALKVLHRLPAADDRRLVGAAMNLDDDQSRQVVSMLPGEAAAFADGMDRPVRIRVPYGGDRELTADRGLAAAVPVPLTGRRSAACGLTCRGDRACSLVEIRAAELLAGSPGDAWIRVWAETLPARAPDEPAPAAGAGAAPAALGQPGQPAARVPAGDRAGPRRCTAASRRCGPASTRGTWPRRAPSTRRACSAGGKGAGTMPGTQWVIPQLRWLHELERACPLDAAGARPVRAGAAA